MQQAKRVAPPAVPEIYRHSGSSFGSAGYGSCDDTANTNIYANDPNASLNVSIRSNASNNSIDLTDSASSRTSAGGKCTCSPETDKFQIQMQRRCRTELKYLYDLSFVQCFFCYLAM